MIKKWKPWSNYSRSKKYSQENYCTYLYLGSTTNDQEAVERCTLVDTTTGNVLGTRKAKNFTLKISCTNLDAINPSPQGVTNLHFIDNIINFIWALVFVPEGVDPSSINYEHFPNSRSLYEPNQNVIMSGVFSAGQSKIVSTKLARNLNYGDRIMLLIWHPKIPSIPVDGDTTIPTKLEINALLSYAICFN